MQIDTDMLSIMLTAGDVMNVRLKIATEARSRPDYSGNMMGKYQAGIYQIYGAADLCYKLSATANHWVPKYNCEIVDDTPPVDPPPVEPPAATRRVVEVEVIGGKAMIRIDGGEWQ
jgi:hypothetical protein